MGVTCPDASSGGYVTISGVSWCNGYSSAGEGEQDEGGVPPRQSAKVSGCGALSILSARVSGAFVGEDMVVECMIMEVGWVVVTL